MKQPEAENSVWQTVKPFYWILKVCGIASYSIDGDIKDGKIKMRLFDVIQLILVFAVQFYFLVINIKVDLSLSKTGKPLIDNGAHLVEIFNGIIIVLVTFFYSYHRRKIWKMFSTFYVFDQEVNHIGILKEYFCYVNFRCCCWVSISTKMAEEIF